MNMKNEEKIYQLNTYNIAEYTSTDYTDNDIAILGDFKNLLFNKYFKLNANIYVVCVKGRLQININTPKYAIYPGEMLICMPNMILSNCTTSSDFKGAMFCLSTQITQKYLHKVVTYGTRLSISARIRWYVLTRTECNCSIYTIR